MSASQSGKSGEERLERLKDGQERLEAEQEDGQERLERMKAELPQIRQHCLLRTHRTLCNTENYGYRGRISPLSSSGASFI